MKGLSISVRLAMWYTSISVAGFAVFGVAMWFVLSYSMLSWKDRTLQMRATRVQAALTAADTSGPALADRLEPVVGVLPEGELIEVVRADGERLYPLAKRPEQPEIPAAGCPAPLFKDFMLHRERFRLLCQPVALAGETVYVLAPSSLLEDRILLHNFTQGLYKALPFIFLISGVGGYTLSRRALRPVDLLIAEASTITPDDLTRRLTVSAPDDQLRRLAIEWNSLLGRIDAAMVRVTQFTADASHELRTPIALIRTTAEYTLGSPGIDLDSRQALLSIVEEAKITGELLDNLLTLARLDTTDKPTANDVVDMRCAAAEITEYFSPIAHRKEQTLDFRNSTASRTAVRIDPMHLRRILTAILDNAIKYTPEHGSITIACDSGEQVAVSITDSGIGIAAEHLGRIFDRFYRVDQARSEITDGVGLGLPIAKLLTELYGGRIQVSSRVGMGSTFTVSFPAVP